MKKMIKINGMHCKSCEKLIAFVVSSIGGARLSSIDSKTGNAVLEYVSEEDLTKIISKIEEEGYRVDVNG